MQTNRGITVMFVQADYGAVCIGKLPVTQTDMHATIHPVMPVNTETIFHCLDQRSVNADG